MPVQAPVQVTGITTGTAWDRRKYVCWLRQKKTARRGEKVLRSCAWALQQPRFLLLLLVCPGVSDDCQGAAKMFVPHSFLRSKISGANGACGGRESSARVAGMQRSGGTVPCCGVATVHSHFSNGRDHSNMTRTYRLGTTIKDLVSPNLT